jgi:hypothetical protein
MSTREETSGQNETGVVYIGGYYHKFEQHASVPLDKKIGMSKTLPSREKALNSTHMTIGYINYMYWECGTKYKDIESGFHTLLDDRRMGNTEFFKDDDEVLVGWLERAMKKFFGLDPILIKADKDSDATEQHAVQEQQNKKDHRDPSMLVGETFYVKRLKYTNSVGTIECVASDRFVVKVDNQKINGEYNTLNKAAMACIDFMYQACNCKSTVSINAWRVPVNSKGETPEEVCYNKKFPA